MPATQGTFATEHASKYLQQLCKHFAHKIEVSFDQAKGTCQFEFGTAHLAADDSMLTVDIDLSDPDKRDIAHMVIDKHLERFAFREGFTKMDWAT